MKLLWKHFLIYLLCLIVTGCTPQILIKDNKIIKPRNYELATLGHEWVTRMDLDTYSNSGLRFYFDFLSKNQAKNQFIFASSAVWTTDINKIIRKKRETFTGEDTLIKYFCDDVQELAGIKSEQIKSYKTDVMFGHNTAELEIDIPASDDFLRTDKESKVKIFVIGKGRRGNPFAPGYDFIVLGYLSHSDNYSESISEFNKLLQSFKMHD